MTFDVFNVELRRNSQDLRRHNQSEIIVTGLTVVCVVGEIKFCSLIFEIRNTQIARWKNVDEMAAAETAKKRKLFHPNVNEEINKLISLVICYFVAIKISL